MGPSRGDIALATRTLLQGECTDFTGPHPAVLPCAKPEVEAEEVGPVEDLASKPRPRGQFIAGLTLIGVGSAALVTGYILLVPRASLAEDWVSTTDGDSSGDPAAQQKWLNMGTGIILSSSVGAASLVAAMPLALPNRAKTPWWAWLSGGLGIGAAAASGYLASTVNDDPKPESCSSASTGATDARACVRRAERTSLAILTGVTAAPLLTIPLVYLIRPKETNVSVSPNIQVLRAGGFVSFRGQF
jgi:hypothetical protein